MPRFDPLIPMPGQLANTVYQARPATLIRNGAVIGNQVATVAGTPSIAAQPYSITYTRAIDQYSWVVTGILYLTRTQLTVNAAAAAFANHLNMYQDVAVTSAGAVLTIVPKDASVTATVAFLPGATLSFSASTVTNSTAPRFPQPGDIVGFSVDPANGEKLIVPLTTTVDLSAANLGVILRPLVEVDPRRAENTTYDVLVDGTVWMQLYGTAPLVPATAAIQIGFQASTTPGRISVAGATAAQFATVNLTAANQTLSKFNILDKNVAVGGRFRLELR